MSEKDNPAERLYRLLSEASKIHSGHVRQALSKVLGVPEDPPDDFIEAVIQFYKLFDDVIHRLRRIEDIDEGIFIKPILRLRNAVPLTNLNAGWLEYRNKISDVDMVSLRHIIHELRRQPFPPKIKQAILDKLEEDVNALYNLVEEAETAEVPEALRTVMLEGLWEILTAIRLHNVRGTEPLRHALLVNIGTYINYWPLFEQHKENEEVSKYKAMIDRLRKTVPWVADISEITGAMIAGARALLSDGQ